MIEEVFLEDGELITAAVDGFVRVSALPRLSLTSKQPCPAYMCL